MEKQMIDLSGAETVHISIDEKGETIWVNVDGVCRLRVQRIKNSVVVDDASKDS